MIREQAPLGGREVTVGDVTARVDPTDLLLAFGGFDVSKMPTVLRLVGDFQGGGILSSAEQIAAARRLPTAEEQQEMGDIASSVLEGLEAAEGNEKFEGVIHGVLVASLWKLLGMTLDDVTDVHSQLSGAVMDATARLRRLGRDDDALQVLLVGQMLYANLHLWLEAGAQ